MERAVEEASDGLRRSRWWAIAAFLLLLTSAWLPWWLVRYESQGTRYDQVAVGLFSPVTPLSNDAGPHATGLLVVAVLLWLFVRVAGRSWLYEPDIWRRDMLLLTAGMGLAAASALGWPDQVPFFWGGQTYSLLNATGEFTETALPGLGWWAACVAAVCAGVAWWMARDPHEDSRRERP